MEKINEIKYTRTHEWCKLESDNKTVTVGITDHAQGLLGELIFIELPDADRSVKQGDEVCVIESVKSASDVYSPVTGTVCAVNQALNSKPELVNSNAMTDGWLFKVTLEDTQQLTHLLSEDEYIKSYSETVTS